MVRAFTLVARRSEAASATGPEPFAGIGDVLHASASRVLLRVGDIDLDVRIASADTHGTVLLGATGPAEHLGKLSVLTRDRDVAEGAHPSEEAHYDAMGLPWIAPELRGTGGEIEAALEHRLPRLIDRSDIRGDLHVHTDWSDGRDSLEDVLAAARSLGYDYVAITDHSESAAASRVLSASALLDQLAAIDALRPQFPELTILCGIEADILRDGSIDCSNELLARLDIVLASLHDPAGHDGTALTRRCLAAIAHPLVNIITHPSNQLVGSRRGYDLDFDALFDAARATGTALEIDGAPSHLDMEGAVARAASAGVTVSIDSDCHRMSLLDRQMRFGVATARRGWIEPRHVLNTRPLPEVRAFLEGKRRRAGWPPGRR
jgi:DNA polymerase (family 10)